MKIACEGVCEETQKQAGGRVNVLGLLSSIIPKQQKVQALDVHESACETLNPRLDSLIHSLVNHTWYVTAPHHLSQILTT